MKLIIGLGNPGDKYKNNRHNAGYQFIDFLASKGETFRSQFLKTDVFMNDSGHFVKKWLGFYKLEPKDLYIVHDDLDLPFGQIKYQFGVGPKVHNGINSVEDNLKAKDFWRVRIGIDNRDPNNRIDGETYVLQDFSEIELILLKKTIFENIKTYFENI